MSWPVLPHGFLGSQVTGDNDSYQIERSLRFNSADSAYLNRTPASAGNRKTWTWSGWVKRSSFGTSQAILGTADSTSFSYNSTFFLFNAANNLTFYTTGNIGQSILQFDATSVFRDPSAWYHIVLYVDTTQLTNTNGIRIYVNGVNQAGTYTAYTQNTDTFINSTVAQYLGRFSSISPASYLNGYLTEVNFIDGQALTPSSFGETDAITGRWKAKAYTGDYGVNGFYLNFSDNSGTTATTLGKDSAPISGTHTAANNWTPNNFSVSSGVGNDSLTDSPANYGTISTTLTDDTYQIQRSLRFNSADSAYLNRTPASAGNRKTWTWSGWVKISKFSSDINLFDGGATGPLCSIWIDSATNKIRWYFTNSAVSASESAYTSALIRDPSAWYHFVFALDTTQATLSERAKIYINGVQQTLTGLTGTYLTQNSDQGINRNVAHYIGAYSYTGLQSYFDGYLTEIHFIDGQALTPDSFGVRDASTYLWKPKAYTGTYGTNGFYLNFSDNSGTTATTLGKDQAGSNNWTPVNFSVASGVGNDSLVDTPTYYGTDTGVGGEARGDYCTLDPTPVTNGTFSQGNLRYVGPGTWKRANGTIAVSTGKWYYEVTLGNAPFSPRNSSSGWNAFGFGLASVLNSTTGANGVSDALTLTDSGYYTNFNGSGTDGGTAFSSGDVLSVAVDLDANTYTFRRNNTQIVTGTIGGTAGRLLTPCIISYDGQYGVMDVNFGQRPFAHAAPSGFRALRDYNKIPVPTGGVVRGNYATLNPLDIGPTSALANGNLDFSTSSGPNYSICRSTIGVSSGKWYWEILVNSSATANMVGVANSSATLSQYLGQNANGWGYYSDGQKYNNGSGSNYGASFTTNDIIGVALNMDAGTLVFYKNNSSQGTAFSGLSGTLFPTVSDASSASSANLICNFGQRPWAYDAPFGFLPLCTALLPTPTIQKPSRHMDVALYTGNGSSQTISSLGFSPDLLIHKQRSAAGNHIVYDSVRGANYLLTNSTASEVSSGVIALNSSGFSVGLGTDVNVNGNTYVAWAWDEAPIAGMDIVSYTGNGTNRTIAHNLGVAPKMIIVKNRNFVGSTNWCVYHSSLSSPANSVFLDTTDAQASYPTVWNSTAPTSSVFSVGTNLSSNGNGNNMIAYLFAEVEGFSKFGSYTGNGSADGPFVWCGFRPRWVMIKRTDSAGFNWRLQDTARGVYNQTENVLNPNLLDAEGTGAGDFDILSNGFKIRITGTGTNASGGTYIFAAFAETAFRYARAR